MLLLSSFTLNRIISFRSQNKDLGSGYGFGHNSYDRGNGTAFKEGVLRAAGGEHEDAGRYRQLLVRTLHACSMKFADVAATVIPVLTDFLSESNEAAATDILVFVREAIQRFENLRPLIVEKLLEVRT